MAPCAEHPRDGILHGVCRELPVLPAELASAALMPDSVRSPVRMAGPL